MARECVRGDIRDGWQSTIGMAVAGEPRYARREMRAAARDVVPPQRAYAERHAGRGGMPVYIGGGSDGAADGGGMMSENAAASAERKCQVMVAVKTLNETPVLKQ